MALIKCSECGNDISDKAVVCPNCGCKVGIKNINKMSLYLVTGFMLIFLLLCVFVLKNQYDNQNVDYHEVVIDVYYEDEDQYIKDIFNYYERLNGKKKEKITLNKYDIHIKINEDRYNEVASRKYSGYGTPLIVLNDSEYYMGIESSQKVINTIEDLLKNGK